MLKLFFLFLCIFVLIAAQGTAAGGDIDKPASRLQHNDPKVRLSAIEDLGRIRDDESVTALISVVENKGEDWRIQTKAIKLLSEIKNPRSIGLLIKVLDDPFFTYDCPALKWNAAIALGNFKNSRAVDALINALTDKILYVREAAIQSLGEIGDERAAPHLISVLGDKSFAIKISAIKALGKIGASSAIPHLKQTADDDTDHYIRGAALEVLKNFHREIH